MILKFNITTLKSIRKKVKRKCYKLEEDISNTELIRGIEARMCFQNTYKKYEK